MNKIGTKLVAIARLALAILGMMLIPFSCSVSALAGEKQGDSNATGGGWYSTEPLPSGGSAQASSDSWYTTKQLPADGTNNTADNRYSIEPLPRQVGDKPPVYDATVASHPDTKPFSIVQIDASPRLQCVQYDGKIGLFGIWIVWGEHECTPDP